jgi:PHD/YefM family antitoxin component YafN of YafNO toxin-antitoxin module
MATETVPEQIPIAEMRDDPDAVIAHARATKRPILVTDNEDAAVIIIDAAEYQRQQAEHAYVRAILEGEDAVRQGRIVSLEEVEARLDALLAEE